MAAPVGDASRQFMDRFSPALIEELCSVYRGQVHYVRDQILHGKVLVMDPSAGSLSSLPAYAYMRKGKVEESGVIEIPQDLLGKRATIDKRLFWIGQSLREKFPEKFDVLAVEYIHHTPMSNTVMPSFQHNIMSHGAIYASIPANHRVDMMPWAWHRNRPFDYIKSDLVDVQLMAKTLLEDAHNALSQKAHRGNP